MKFLSQLESVRASEEERMTGVWRGLLHRAAHGEELTEAEVAELDNLHRALGVDVSLEAAAKLVLEAEALDVHVEESVKRRGQVADLEEEVRQHQAKRQELESRHAEALRTLRAVSDGHDARRKSLAAQQRICEDRLSLRKVTRGKLWRFFGEGDPKLMEAMAAASAKLKRNTRRIVRQTVDAVTRYGLTDPGEAIYRFESMFTGPAAGDFNCSEERFAEYVFTASPGEEHLLPQLEAALRKGHKAMDWIRVTIKYLRRRSDTHLPQLDSVVIHTSNFVMWAEDYPDGVDLRGTMLIPYPGQTQQELDELRQQLQTKHNKAVAADKRGPAFVRAADDPNRHLPVPPGRAKDD